MSELKGYKLAQWKLLQGQFLDRKKYDHMGSDWKAARDHEEKMTIRLGSLEGLIVARVQSHTLPPQDAEKFVGQLVRAHNALAGRDPEKLEGFVKCYSLMYQRLLISDEPIDGFLAECHDTIVKFMGDDK